MGAVHEHQEATMSKYLLLKHYRGGPEPHRTVPPMDEWAPEDVEAHMAFLRHVTELLQANGEYVDAQGPHAGPHVGAVRRTGRGGCHHRRPAVFSVAASRSRAARSSSE